MASTPKVPEKSAEQKQLEQAQLAEYNRRLAEENAAIAQRKASIQRASVGRRSLLTGGELGSATSTINVGGGV